MVNGNPSTIEPTEKQYHGSLTSEQHSFVHSNFNLRGEQTHRKTTDFPKDTTYVADHATAQQYSTIEPGIPYMTHFRVVCKTMIPRVNHEGRILFATGPACQLIMRPYTTDNWLDSGLPVPLQ